LPPKAHVSPSLSCRFCEAAAAKADSSPAAAAAGARRSRMAAVGTTLDAGWTTAGTS
jgi:hypothetical protein